jgi:hypothetical protein
MSSNMVARRIDEIKGMNEFPLPKGPALALIRLTQREFVSLAVVAHAIKADPTFAVRAIRWPMASPVPTMGRWSRCAMPSTCSACRRCARWRWAFSLLENYRASRMPGL